MNMSAILFIILLTILALYGHPFWALFIFFMFREEVL